MKLTHSLLLLSCSVVSIVTIWYLFPAAAEINKGERSKVQAIPSNIGKINDTAVDGLVSKLSSLNRESNQLKLKLKSSKKEILRLRKMLNNLSQQDTFNDNAVEAITMETTYDLLDEADELHEIEIKAFESSLYNEHVDAQWSNNAVAEIEQTLFQPELEETSLINVDCRATLCRVEVEHTDTRAKIQFQSLFSQRRSDADLKSTLVRSNQGHEGNRTIVYLTRSGYDLPHVNTH